MGGRAGKQHGDKEAGEDDVDNGDDDDNDGDKVNAFREWNEGKRED